jgi:acyl-CoA thioesterase-1
MAMRLLIFLFLLLASGAGTAAETRVLVIGDSLSAAYDMPTEQGWVALLDERLGEQAKVINAAISGDTSASARARLPRALDAHAPDVVIIAVGGNDGLRGIPLAALRRNLTAMIDQARATGARVLLAGVRLPTNYGPAFIDRFLATFGEVADATGVAFVPRILEGVAGDPALMLDDGIHPNADAQPIILDNIWQALAPMLATQHAG